MHPFNFTLIDNTHFDYMHGHVVDFFKGKRFQAFIIIKTSLIIYSL